MWSLEWLENTHFAAVAADSPRLRLGVIEDGRLQIRPQLPSGSIKDLRRQYDLKLDILIVIDS